jgi:hypothetical protein
VSTPPSASHELIEHNFGAEVKQRLDEYVTRTRHGMVELPGVSFPLWESEFELGVRHNWG